MKLTIQYTGQLANLLGISEEDVEVEPGAELQSVVDQIVERHGSEVAIHFRNEEGLLPSTLLVILDNEQVEGDRARLDVSQAKTLMFMTPIAGG